MEKAKRGYGERPCWECGKIFYARQANQVFCSVPCQKQYQRRRNREKALEEWEKNPRYCPYCGGVVPFGRRIYCSTACNKGMQKKEAREINQEIRRKKAKAKAKEPGLEAKAKALGMTYGQYRARKGIPPEDIAKKYSAPAYEPEKWLGNVTVEIEKDPPPAAPAKIRRRIK